MATLYSSREVALARAASPAPKCGNELWPKADAHLPLRAYRGAIARLQPMMSKPDVCFPIVSPAAVALTGYYPTRSCVRYAPAKNEYTVSMEDFVLRNASPPEPAANEKPD